MDLMEVKENLTNDLKSIQSCYYQKIRPFESISIAIICRLNTVDRKTRRVEGVDKERNAGGKEK